jgi:hypothetical protein
LQVVILDQIAACTCAAVVPAVLARALRQLVRAVLAGQPATGLRAARPGLAAR